MSWIESNFQFKLLSLARCGSETASPKRVSITAICALCSFKSKSKLRRDDAHRCWAIGLVGLRSPPQSAFGLQLHVLLCTYKIPEHVVQTKLPEVMFTYVTPFCPQSKHWRFPPVPTISRKSFSILSLVVSAFGFSIFVDFELLFVYSREWITKKNNFAIFFILDDFALRVSAVSYHSTVLHSFTF